MQIFPLIDQSAGILSQSTSTTQSHPAHHVKFSPDALFTSPQGGRHRRSRAGDNHTHASIQHALRSAQNDDFNTNSSVSSANNAGVMEVGGADVVVDRSIIEQEIETLDEPKYSSSVQNTAGDGTSTRSDAGFSERLFTSTTHPSGAATSVPVGVDESGNYDDYSIHSASLSYLAQQQPSFGAYGASSSNTGGGMSRYGMASAAASLSMSGDMSAGINDFSAISDGGYHEGYWRAKYHRPNKQ